MSYFSHGTTLGVNTLLERDGVEVDYLQARVPDILNYDGCAFHKPMIFLRLDLIPMPSPLCVGIRRTHWS